jgi:Zn-finger nucleic acid-binding protein
MDCPVCKPTQALVLAPLEGGNLTARRCPSCNGHWIRSTDFWRWRAIAGENLPETPAPAGALTPPEAGRYKVGHGVGFTVDRCRHCEGAWLDGGEWEALRLRNLHDDLPQIFDDAWQRAVKREVQELTSEESFRRRLGDETDQRAHETRAWLDAHPRRSELFAYLQLKQRRD